MTVLQAMDLWKRYGRRSDYVLQGVSLSVRPGELVSVTGENGSGKSTLLSILANELAPTKGAVLRSGRIGYCPQQPALYPRLTVDEHFALYAAAGRLDKDQVAETRKHVLATLGFERFADVQSRNLSGGTRSKLNLGLSLLGDPNCLVLDEPYAAFDLSSYEAFWSLIDDQRAYGRAVIVVAHMELEAARFDQRWSLNHGTLTEETSSSC